MELSLLNGATSELSLDNRAAAFGDGVFETILHGQNGFEFLDDHFNRLQTGADRLSLNWNETDHLALKERIKDLSVSLSAAHVVKIMLVRKQPGRGYQFSNQLQTTDWILQVRPYQPPGWVERGAKIELARTQISENISLAGLKHLNRLDSVLARASVSSSLADEVLLKNSSEQIIEGSMSNVFLKMGGVWKTPSLKCCGVEGVIRKNLLTLFPEIKIDSISERDFTQVESGFICNSLIGIVPIVSLSGQLIEPQADIQTFKKELFHL